MVDRAGEGGFTVIEAICALGIVAVIAAATLMGGGGQLAHIGASFDAMVALRQASGRLEVVSMTHTPPVAGETEFELDDGVLAGARGVQRVTEIQPGLFDVTVRIEHRSGRSVELTTRFARERKP